MPRQLTVRGVSEEIAERLESLSRERRQSVNATVLEILAAGVGVEERRRRLERYVTWSREDLASFEGALALQRTIDDELWR